MSYRMLKHDITIKVYDSNNHATLVNIPKGIVYYYDSEETIILFSTYMGHTHRLINKVIRLINGCVNYEWDNLYRCEVCKKLSEFNKGKPRPNYGDNNNYSKMMNHSRKHKPGSGGQKDLVDAITDYDCVGFGGVACRFEKYAHLRMDFKYSYL